MKNYVQPGKTITVAAPTGGVTSGQPVLIGALFGVAAFAAAEAAEVEIATVGVFDLPKATGAAWAIGDQLYWDASAGNLTKAAGENLSVGVAVAAAGTNDTVGRTRIGRPLPSIGPIAQQAAIADLAAITGGESPTEAEHNAIVTKVNDILAKLRLAGVIEDA